MLGIAEGPWEGPVHTHPSAPRHGKESSRVDSPVPRAAAGRPFLGPSPLGLQTLPSQTRSLQVRAAPTYPSQHGGLRNWRAGTVLSPCTCSGLIRKRSGGFISLLEARVEDGLPLGEPIFAWPVP